MLNKILNKFNITYVKKTVEADHLDKLGYSKFVLKIGKRSLVYKKVDRLFWMIQYTNNITEYSLLKEFKDD